MSVSAEAGGSYGSYGSYGGSSGGASYGSSGGGSGSNGGGLLSRIHARHAAFRGGSSGGSYGASSGGSASSWGGSSGGSSGGNYVASYASTGSSGGGLFSRLRAHIEAKRARHASRRGAWSGSYASGYSSGGASSGGHSSGGYSSGGYTSGYSSGGASSGGSSGGYYSPAVNVAPMSYGSSGGYATPGYYGEPMIQSNYPMDGYPMDGYPTESYPMDSYPSDNFVPADGSKLPSDAQGGGSDPAGDSKSKSKKNSDTKGGADPLGDSVIDGSARFEAQKPSLDDDTALLTVSVPVSSAHVTVNGRETTSDGTVRQFMSRGLKPGYVYAYEVVVTYDVNGQEQTETKSVKLRPGDAERLVFQQDAAAGAEEITPAAEAVDSDLNATEVNSDKSTDATETVVQLLVPANAVVTLAGNETKGFGRVRTFRTTQLAAGQSWTDYTVSVTATVNGRSIRQERTINVAAGSTVELEFDVTAGQLAMR